MNIFKSIYSVFFLGIVFSSGSLLGMSSGRLVSAVKGADVVAAQKAIDQGADVNAKDIVSMTRKTALMLAVERNDLPMAKLLIEKGANLNARNWLGQTPLIIAADLGNLEMARLLLDSGAVLLKPTLSPAGYPQKYRTALMHAVARNNMPMTQLLLERGADPTVRVGQHFVDLIEGEKKGPDDLRAFHTKGATISVLDLAAAIGNEQMVKLLLDTGTFDDFERTLASFRARDAGHSKMVLLLSKEEGALDRAFIAAILSNDVAQARHLLDEGAYVDAKKNFFFGSNAVGLAISKNNPEMVELLLDRKALYVPGSLFQALMGGNMKVARLLFKKDYGSTFERLLFRIFNKVAVSGQDVALIMRYAAKKVSKAPITEQETAQMRAAAKRTGISIVKIAALIAAGKFYRFTQTESLHTAVAVGSVLKVKAFLAMGYPVDQRDSIGWTPLMHAVVAGDVNMVKLLIQHGAQVNATDIAGVTSLMRAAVAGDVQVAQLLIQHGAQVNATDITGVTPFMYAAMAGDVNMVKLLMQNGADPQMQDNTGQKAYDHAALFPAVRRELTWGVKKVLERGRRQPTSPLSGLPPEIAEMIAREAVK